MNNFFIALVFLAIFWTSCTQQQHADLIISGGNIYTVNDQQPTVEAVAIKDEKIIFAGSEAEARKFISDDTEILDLQGKTMTPGFIEGHGHIMGIGYAELNLDLMEVKSYEELVEKVKNAVEKAAPGEWIIGRGWHQDKWASKPEPLVKGFPVHNKLSEISPDNPVFLYHASGHAAFANAKAMEIARINQLGGENINNEIAGGEILKDDLGNATGLFNERAMYLISQHVPETSEKKSIEALELAIKACLRNGITSFHDAGAQAGEIALFKSFKENGKLNTRLYVMLSGNDRNLLEDWFSKGPEIDPEGRLTIRSVKLHCDGALGSRGAWLLEPYADRSDTYGMPTISMDTVVKISKNALDHGFQICAHAIGDRTNKEILDIYEGLFNEQSEKAVDHRFRIEHAQHLHPDDIPRFAKLGVIPAMQAIHMSSDRPWAIERLGEKRIVEGAYMWQSLLRSGAKIINGTDAPVESLNPLPSFYASVSRKTLEGKPENGFEPDEKMTRSQALRSYTLDAAYGAFEDHLKGSIEIGKLADFTVFNKDIMEIPEEEIVSTEVEYTIVGGRVLYQRK